MALLTDDQDIREVYMSMDFGGNGDYYITLTENKEAPVLADSGPTVIKTLSINMRISTSGGNAPTDVKIACANLYRAMEAAGLNQIYYYDKKRN